MADAISFVRVGRDDLDSLVDLMTRFEADMASIDGYENQFDPAAARAKLERHGFGKETLFEATLVLDAGQPRGYALYSLGFRAEGMRPTLFLSDLFVLAEHRSTGLGEALMRHLADMARQRGIETLTWSVWRKNPAAIKFYRRLGATGQEEDLPMSLSVADLLTG